MMFRNSYRLLFANFGIFWKDYLYKIIVIGITACLVLPVLSSLQNVSSLPQFFSQLRVLLINFPFSDIEAYLGEVWKILQITFDCFRELFTINAFAVIYLLVIFFFVFPFLISLSDIVVGEMIYGSMSSLAKFSYAGSFIKKIGKSSLYSLLKTLIFLPFLALLGFILFGLLQLGVNSEIWMLFTPFLMLVTFQIIYGMRLNIFTGWMPSIVVFGTPVLKSLNKGLIATNRRFFKSFSSVVMLLLIHFLFATLFGAFSLLLILPLFHITFCIYQMVMFFGSQGMRYYVDLDTILSPKKLEETDKIKKAKHII